MTSEQPYTPPTDEVRGAYQAWNQDVGGDPYLPEQSAAEFDRWLDQVKADARREGQADAWANAVDECYALGSLYDYDRDEAHVRNPYRNGADQ